MSLRWKEIFCSTICFSLATAAVFSADYIVSLGSDSAVNTGGATGELRYTLNQILNSQAQGTAGPFNITFSVPSVSLNALPPPINLFTTDTITIGNSSGSPTTIDGNGFRPFFIRQGTVTLQNMNIQGGVAQGGSGAGGGGGGMGAGGAVFVDGATVTIKDVVFTSNTASAGFGASGGAPGAGGAGGGLGGNGGSNNGGGGGYSGNGGGNSGGGGSIADGGNGNGTNAGGGGGGAIIGATGGAAGTAGGGNGSPGGTVGIYVFGGGGGQGGNGTGAGGAGGGMNPGPVVRTSGGGGGYNGSASAGGIGGGGGSSSPSGLENGGVGGGGGSVSGNGGYGGGGGNQQGNGGFGGGGGNLGDGGFGGGGGFRFGSLGGQGGFGGGGGGGEGGPGGVGAVGNLSVGGDGAGLGGAIFVNTGTIIFQGNCSTVGNTASANGGAGASAGFGIFAVSGATLTFAPDSGSTITISESIADDSLSSIPSGQAWTPGTGAGASLTMQGPGNLILNGVSTYSGMTSVTGGKLSVNGQILGGVTVSSGATLGGVGTIFGGGTISGTLSPGNSIGNLTFNTSSGNINLGSTAVTNIEISPATSSQVIVTGTGELVLGGTVNVTQDAGSYAATGTYTIVQGPYSGTFDPIVTGGLSNFHFSLSYAPNFVYLLYAPQISTKGLTGNNLKIASYFNSNASIDVINLFSSLNQAELTQALESAAPTRSAFATYASQNGYLASSQVLSDHLRHGRLHQQESASNPIAAAHLDSDQLLAYTSREMLKAQDKQTSCDKQGPCAMWLGTFGEYAHKKAQNETPAFNVGLGGVIAAFDYNGTNANVVGVGVAYVHSHLHESDGMGSASVDQGYMTAYGTLNAAKWYFDLALWGGYYHTSNRRKISFSGFHHTAKSQTHGWQVAPHLEIGYDGFHLERCQVKWFGIEPFLMGDWVGNWEQGFQEHGANILNMRQKGRFCSLFRGETGLRFHEIVKFDWGNIVFREKGSYAYQKTFHTGFITSSLIGTPGSFTVTTLTGAQNLGVFEFSMLVRPNNDKAPYVDVRYQGEFGSSYQSHQGIFEIGKFF